TAFGPHHRPGRCRDHRRPAAHPAQDRHQDTPPPGALRLHRRKQPAQTVHRPRRTAVGADRDRVGHRGHGRIELRTIRALLATDTIKGLFPHVEQVFLLERHIYAYDGTLVASAAVLGITSLPADQADAAAIAAYVRGHWSVEVLHHLRDTVLGEDASRVKAA